MPKNRYRQFAALAAAIVLAGACSGGASDELRTQNVTPDETVAAPGEPDRQRHPAR